MQESILKNSSISSNTLNISVTNISEFNLLLNDVIVKQKELDLALDNLRKYDLKINFFETID